MKFLTQDDLIKQGSFYYEFALANASCCLGDACGQSLDAEMQHNNKNSLYLRCEDFWRLSPYIDAVFAEYPYYGPKKMFVKEWNELKASCTLDEEGALLLRAFFEEVDEWLLQENRGCGHFWILGV